MGPGQRCIPAHSVIQDTTDRGRPLEIPTIVVFGDGRSLEATNQREAIIPPKVGLTNVLHISGLKENLFLMSMASTLSRAKIVMENGSCQVMKDRRVVLSAKKQGGVFRVMAALVTESEKGGNNLINYH